MESNEEDEINQFHIDPSTDDDFMINLFNSNKPKAQTNEKIYTLACPDKIDEVDLDALLLDANEKQRQLLMHVLKCFKTGIGLPLKLLILGRAGVGKSYLIKLICIHTYIMYY